MQWFSTPIDAPVLIVLAVAYFLLASFTTLDVRLIQAKRDGRLEPDAELLPQWTGVFIYLEYLVGLAIFLLNWKYWAVLWIIKFVLKVLPVLETIGNVLARPLRGKGYRGTL